MTPAEKKKLSTLWVALSAYYRIQLPDQVIQLYVDDLADIPLDQIEQALGSYRRNPKNKSMPLPAQIREIVTPVIGESDIATDLAKKICASIRRHSWSWCKGEYHNGRDNFWGAGQPWPTFDQAVLVELGDVALEVIKRRGGWTFLYEEFANSSESTFTAQLRDHIQAVLRLKKANQLNQNPSLVSLDERRLHNQDQELRAKGIQFPKKASGDDA